MRAQAQIDRRLIQMSALPKEQWPRKWTKPYKGYDQIFELRIFCDNIQYRPLAFFGPDRRQITLLIGTVERDWKIPQGDLERAVTRRDMVLKDRRHVREHRYD